MNRLKTKPVQSRTDFYFRFRSKLWTRSVVCQAFPNVLHKIYDMKNSYSLKKTEISYEVPYWRKIWKNSYSLWFTMQPSYWSLTRLVELIGIIYSILYYHLSSYFRVICICATLLLSLMHHASDLWVSSFFSFLLSFEEN